MARAGSGVVAYADGSCIGNPGPGGWGVLIVSANGSTRELAGADPSTTNNRMEITAAIQALKALAPGATVTVRSDSRYVINTMTQGWRRRENLDLWRELDAEAAKRHVQWEWVRGHAGDTFNERADELARSAALGKSPSASVATKSESDEPDSGSAERETATIEELRGLLGKDETIRRCANCGRAFVASSNDASLLAYCSLAPCQLATRRRRE